MHDRVSAQRIVDAHVHWWDLERNYYPWLMDRRHTDGESGLSEEFPAVHGRALLLACAKVSRSPRCARVSAR